MKYYTQELPGSVRLSAIFKINVAILILRGIEYLELSILSNFRHQS